MPHLGKPGPVNKGIGSTFKAAGDDAIVVPGRFWTVCGIMPGGVSVVTTPPDQVDALFSDDALAALDIAPAIIRDLDGTIRFWSRGASRLYGFTRQQAVGRLSHDLLATRFPQSLQTIQSVLASAGEWYGELEHTASDGRTVYVASQWALRRDAQGDTGRVVEINQDITYQQPRLAAIRRLAAIVESSSDAIVGKTLDGLITHWNRAAETMFGYAASEVIGQPILMLFPPEYEAEERSIIEQVRRGERTSHQTLRRRKDGTVFPAAVTVSPILDESGTIVGASTILRDLTQQRERDERLRDAQRELFHVQRLTELGQLMSSLVHEVNQPLAAIGNYAAAGRRLLSSGQGNGASAALQKIVEQTERAHQIIQRLRNFVKKGGTEQQDEDLAAMIGEAVALAMVTLRRDPATVRTRLKPANLRVIADRVQIQQVLFNLLRNAAEAMEQSDRREILVSARRVGPDMVEVSVADSGPGLPPEVRANLFRPFVTTKEGGMGVGLSVCRSIIEAHRGRLWAEENPGGGTVFRFTVPAADAGVAASAPPAGEDLTTK